MNERKIVSQIINCMYNRKSGKPQYWKLSEGEKIWRYCIKNDKVYVANNYCIFIFDKKTFPLNVKAVWGTIQGAGEVNLDSVLKHESEAKFLVDTELVVTTKSYREHRCKLLKCDDETIFIKEEYSQYFDNTALYKGINKRSPVFVYEGDELKGVLAPSMLQNEYIQYL